jgi:hypothetical protein
LKGNEFRDKVCLSANQCVNNFRYFLIEKQQGTDNEAVSYLTDPVDGVLGLALGANKGRIGPLYAKALFPMTSVSPPTFAFYLDDVGKDSWIDFGGYKTSAIKEKKADKIAWLSVKKDNFFWSTNCLGLGFGTIKNNDKIIKFQRLIGEEKVYTIFNTGDTKTKIPSAMWNLFLAYLMNPNSEISFKLVSGQVLLNCADRSKLRPLYFLFEGNTWLVMDPEDYSYVIDWADDFGCTVAFESYPFAYFTLGTSFFKGYYAIHDMNDAKLGFVPHATSRKALNGGLETDNGE